MSSNPSPVRPAVTGVSRNARLGLVLFALYCIVYVGFILFSAFGLKTMGRAVFHGVNFAIVYGFGLIIGAFVLALLYMVLCVSEAAPVPDLSEGQIADAAQKEEGAA